MAPRQETSVWFEHFALIFPAQIIPAGHRFEYTTLCSQSHIFKAFQGSLHCNRTASELIVSYPEITCYSFFILFLSTVASRKHKEQLKSCRDGKWTWGILIAVSVTLKAMLVQYKESLSGGYLPSLKIISGIRFELLKIPRVAAVFLQRVEVLLKNSAKRFKRRGLCNNVHILFLRGWNAGSFYCFEPYFINDF